MGSLPLGPSVPRRLRECRWRQSAPSPCVIGVGRARQSTRHAHPCQHARTRDRSSTKGGCSAPHAGGALTPQKGVPVKYPPEEPEPNSPERGASAHDLGCAAPRASSPLRSRTVPTIPHRRFRASEEGEAPSASTPTGDTDPSRQAWRFASVDIGKKDSAVALVTPDDSAALLVRSERGPAGRRRVER